MNILSQLPFFKSEDPEAATEAALAEEKRARIEFHRRMVRNGPASFKTATEGQIRRQKKRDLARQTRKARRAQIRAYFAGQREAAVLRGMLQAAGIIDYSGTFEVEPQRAYRAIVWILERFAEGEGQIVVTNEVVAKALTKALNRWQTLVGLPVTPLSPAYQLPVAVAA